MFRVQIGTWLINQVYVARLGQAEYDGDSLEFTSGKGLNFVVKQRLDGKGDQNLCFEQT